MNAKEAAAHAVLEGMPSSAPKTAPLLALMALMALLGPGCRQTIHSQVSTFNQLVERPRDATYAMMPLAKQRGSRAFKDYEERVRAHLEANGFVPEALDRAEFVVVMAYANDDGTDVLASYPIIGQTGSSSSRMAGTLREYRDTTSYSATTERTSTPATQTVTDEDGPARSDVPRVLRLDIVRRDSIGMGHIEKVYEGEVVSTGSDDDLAEIVPAMIEALFQDFPGRDGEVRHVATKTVPSLDELTAPAADCPSDSDCADAEGKAAPGAEPVSAQCRAARGAPPKCPNPADSASLSSEP